MESLIVSAMWLMLIISFLVLESITLSFVGMWFVVGSIAGLILNMLGFGFEIQISVAVFVTVISLLTIYPHLKRSVKVKRTNVMSLIGRQVSLKEPILFNQYGVVSVNGVLWTATCVHEIKNVDIPVVVVAVEGNKLVVECIEN